MLKTNASGFPSNDIIVLMHAGSDVLVIRIKDWKLLRVWIADLRPDLAY